MSKFWDGPWGCLVAIAVYPIFLALPYLVAYLLYLLMVNCPVVAVGLVGLVLTPLFLKCLTGEWWL